MNSLSTTGQTETWMGLTRQQLQVTIVLLVLIAAMAIAMVGATIYVGEQAYSTDSSSLMAGMTRCPRGCPIYAQKEHSRLDSRATIDLETRPALLLRQR
jgi:hypothetical protein